MGAKITGADELIADLTRAAEHVIDETKAVVKRGAQNIKRDTQARWAGARYAPSLAAAVSYDVTSSAASVKAEIGPDKAKRQGALGNIYEYGVPGTAPQPALSPALDAEEPRFVKALEDMAVNLLDGKR
jgi:hypothetical protein